MNLEPPTRKRIVRCVLVVDDDENDREAARLWMPDQEVLVEADGIRAQERVRAEKLDLVIADVWLDREATGVDLARTLKAQDANLPVVLISSGFTARSAALLARRNPADLILPKQGRRTFEEILAFIECDIEPDPWDERDVSVSRNRHEFALYLLARSGGNKAEAARRANVTWSTMHRWLGADGDNDDNGRDDSSREAERINPS